MSDPEYSFADLIKTGVENWSQDYMKSMLPTWVQVGIEQGLSGRQMLAQARAGGMRIADKAFYTVLGEVKAIEGASPTWAGLSPVDIPSLEDFQDLSTIKAHGLMYRFEILVEDEEGNRSWLQRGTKVNEPTMIGDLMSDWADLFVIPAEEGGGQAYDETFLGIRLSGLYNLTPGL